MSIELQYTRKKYLNENKCEIELRIMRSCLVNSINMGSVAIVVFIGIFIILCGCVSQQKENTTVPTILVQKSTTGTTSQPSGDRYWIQMVPLEKIQKGKNIFISGTTNLTAGTEITVSYSMLAHSCVPPRIPDKQGERTFCGGSCQPGVGSSYIIRVVEGERGINSWNATLNTTGWCTEIYSIGVDASDGANATHVGQNIRFFPS